MGKEGRERGGTKREKEKEGEKEEKEEEKEQEKEEEKKETKEDGLGGRRKMMRLSGSKNGMEGK